MIRLLINGKEIDHGTITIITGTDRSEPRPPKEDKPPVRNTINSREGLGVLTKGFNSRSITLNRRELFSEAFSLPADSTADRITFTFAPQNRSPGDIRLWVSDTPGGKPIRNGWILGKVADVVAKGQRVNMQCSLGVAVEGGSLTRRYAVITPGQQYYFNAMLLNGPVGAPIEWTLGGNF